MLLKSMARSSCLLLVGTLAFTLSGCGSSAPKGDAAKGKELYAQCAGCHSLTENSVGPKHCGVVGRMAGSVPDYAYSEAMKQSGLTWDAKTLDEFLTAPISYVNGTKMGFAGLSDPTQRADVIAYLQQASGDASVCPPGAT